ncbi:YnbE family lipoprotein [Thorsellia kenyensis]|uniref:YnbE family lipoprotein n=1 Tax=Thorsellia kenyensis TaxID=1549888 RepID=A0ABV6CA00_9GAMM
MRFLAFFLPMTFIVLGCTPRIEVVTPDKPIIIDLNIKIDHNIHIKVDKEIETLINSNEALFSS